MSENEPKPGCSKSVEKGTDDGNIPPAHDPKYPVIIIKEHESGMKYPSGHKIIYVKSKYDEHDQLIKKDVEKDVKKPKLDKDNEHDQEEKGEQQEEEKPPENENQTNESQENDSDEEVDEDKYPLIANTSSISHWDELD